jgi:phosphate-selective porin OprO/OprP
MNDRKKAIAAALLEILLAMPTVAARADDTAAEIRLLKERLKQLDPLKARLRQLEEKVAKQDREQKETKAQVRNATNVANAAAQGAIVCKDAPCPPPPPPVFVSFKNGLFVESLDHAFSFKVGGRIFLDGGGSTQPELGKSGNAGIAQARLEVEGKAFRFWSYRLQYDFAGSNTFTASGGSTTTPLGGMRDAYLALAHPALAVVPFSSDPLVLQVGNFYEPFGLERINSKKYVDFIERALPSDAFGPSRHIGFAAFAHGSNWTAKAGVFTTSLEDKALSPAAGIPVPFGVPTKAGWVATGGGQYFDITGRVTYAPIKEEDRLLHIGGSGRFHRPNDSTAANDDRVLALGSNIRTEANILGENLLGTTDLSCGAAPSYNGAVGTALVAGKCVKTVVGYGAELAAAYGPFSVQAEYLGAHYERNPNALAFANASGVFAPGGSSLDFNGYYVYATWYLTGESRAASYRVDNLGAPATFGQIKIKHPWSAGGWGAWELAARFSEVNLNNGPFQGSYYQNLIALAPNAATRMAVANAGVLGGREENVTVGLNWYPDTGVRIMANWTRVLKLSAPWDRAYLNGAQPNIFLLRTQVDW